MPFALRPKQGKSPVKRAWEKRACHSSPRRASYSPRQSSQPANPGIRRLRSRVATSLRDGAILFEGQLSLSSDKYARGSFVAARSCRFDDDLLLRLVTLLCHVTSEVASLQIQWHSDPGTRLIITLLSHPQYHSKRCYVSDERLRAFLRASVDPTAGDIISIVDSDTEWKRCIMSRQFCTQIASALAPHFR
jgi:hypothetical protein